MEVTTGSKLTCDHDYSPFKLHRIVKYIGKYILFGYNQCLLLFARGKSVQSALELEVDNL